MKGKNTLYKNPARGLRLLPELSEQLIKREGQSRRETSSQQIKAQPGRERGLREGHPFSSLNLLFWGKAGAGLAVTERLHPQPLIIPPELKASRPGAKTQEKVLLMAELHGQVAHSHTPPPVLLVSAPVCSGLCDPRPEGMEAGAPHVCGVPTSSCLSAQTHALV